MPHHEPFHSRKFYGRLADDLHSPGGPDRWRELFLELADGRIPRGRGHLLIVIGAGLFVCLVIKVFCGG